MPPTDRRRSPRLPAHFDALVSAGSEEGAGRLADLSLCGARLDDASIQPPVGTPVRLYVFIQPVAPFEVSGVVARHTETGFALDFEIADDELRRLVEEVRAHLAPAVATG